MQVFPTNHVFGFTHIHFCFRPVVWKFLFQFSSLESNSSMAYASSTRSSAYKNSHGQSVQNSCDNASRTMINNKGLSTDLWWTPNCALKTSLNLLFTLTWLLASRYITCITRTIQSSIQTFCKAYHRNFLITLSKAFPISTKSKNRFKFFLMYASWNCLTIMIALVVPGPNTNPNCISSILIILRMKSWFNDSLCDF